MKVEPINGTDDFLVTMDNGAVKTVSKKHHWQLWLAIFIAIQGCATYQVMDMKRVPKHPRPDSAAEFPMRQP